MSAVLAIAEPRRIKASHRRRRKVTVGRFVQRYYDPGIGRFLSTDPVATNSDDGTNFSRYWYANNNPYMFTDPDGRHPALGPAGEFGAWIRSIVESKGDEKKVAAATAKRKEEKLKTMETIVDMTHAGLAKDAIVIAKVVADGKDPTAKAAGSLTGEVASKATEAALKGKIGDGPAEVVGTIVGNSLGSAVESAAEPKANPPKAVENKPARKPEEKQPPIKS